MKVGRLAAGIFLLSLFACAGMQGTGKPGRVPLSKTPEMEKAFHAAEGLFYARRFREAEGFYQSYLTSFPYNQLTPKAHFRLGEVRFHEKDYRRAISFYKKSNDRGVDPQWGAMAVYKQAVSYSKMDELKRVFPTLDRIPSDHADTKVRVRAGSLRVSTARKLSNPYEERKGYLELIDAYEGGLPPSEAKIGDLNWVVSEVEAREALRQWISEEEGPTDDVARLKGWMKRFEGKTSGGYVSWRVAKIFHRKGDYEKAAEWGRQYLTGYPKHEYASAARVLLKEVDKRGEIPEQAGGRKLVGVLLPLSGKFGVYGESVLHGLECAAGVFAPCRGDLGLNLLIRDSEGDPKTASKIVEEFARLPDVRAVVGPLPQVEADAAASVAESNGLPMITLSQKPGIAQEGAFVFRNFLTVADQVATLVDYACDNKHWKKFAILFPQDPAGEEYRKAFEEEVDRCGGKVVARAGYAPGSKSLTEAVRTLKFSSAEQRADAPVPFEALFFPDVYRRIPDLVATLKFLKVEGVHLMGGAGWDHPSLAQSGATDLEGALYVSAFYSKGGSFSTRDFVSMFQSAYGFEPTLLEAYAYDTLRLLGEVLKDNPEADRAAVQHTLARKRNFAGVTGEISFDEEGDARRRLFVLTIEGGEIREIQ